MKKSIAIILICVAFVIGGILGGIIGATVYEVAEEIDEAREYDITPPSNSGYSSDRIQQPSSGDEGYITRENAKEIALEKAGLSTNDVKFTKIELEYGDNYGVWYYEVEFRKGAVEYEIAVDAVEGAVLSFESDIID